MPPAAILTRARRSVALVTTVQRFAGSDASSSEHAGQHADPLVVLDFQVLKNLDLRFASRSGRSLATVSMARQPCVMLQAYAGSMPRIPAHLVQLRSTEPSEEMRIPSMSKRMPWQRICTGEEEIEEAMLRLYRGA